MDEQEMAVQDNVVEDATTPVESVEDLRAQLKAKDDEVARLAKAADIGERIASGLKQLAPETKNSEPAKIKTVEETLEEIDFEKGFYEDPKKALKAVADTLDAQQSFKLAQLVAETQKQTDAVIAQNIKAVKADPEKAWVLEKYKAEFDQILATCDPKIKRDPEIVDKVITLVQANHLQEVTARAVDRELKKQQTTKTHTESSGNVPPRPAVKVTVTPEAKKMALVSGLPEEYCAKYLAKKGKS